MTPSGVIATWFGSGLLKPAPGTWGTLAALPFAWVIDMAGRSIGIPFPLLLAALLLFPIGVWASARYDASTGGHDASEIVVDEVVGVWIALSIVPADWIHYLAAFVLFRVFDIWKPWPIRWADRTVAGGLGVMLDDVLAGLAAAGALWGLGVAFMTIMGGAA